MYKPHATITKEQMSTTRGTQDLIRKTTQTAMRTRYGDTIRFAKDKSRDAGSCVSYHTNETCTGHIEFPLNPAKQKCAWCVAMVKNSFGVTSRCVSCAEVKKMETLKFSCSPSAEMCERTNDEKEEKIKDMKKLQKRTLKKEDDLPDAVKVIVDQVSGNIIASLGPTLHLPLSINLHRHLNSTISRTAGRSLTQTMTTALTQRLTSSLAQSLIRTLSSISSKELVAYLTPSLTHAIVPAVSQSLLRSPASDYYCFYCREHRVYCDECHQSQQNSENRNFYADYYSTCYSKYYSNFYSGIYADQAVRDSLANYPGVMGNSNPKMKEENKAKDGEFSKYAWKDPDVEDKKEGDKKEGDDKKKKKKRL